MADEPEVKEEATQEPVKAESLQESAFKAEPVQAPVQASVQKVEEKPQEQVAATPPKAEAKTIADIKQEIES